MPNFTKDLISSLNAVSRWIGTFLGAACVQVSGEICTLPLENILYLQSNQNSVKNLPCFVNGSLFTEVLPLCGCWTFLKAKESPGLKTCFCSLWTCAQCAGVPLREVFCMFCIPSACLVVIAGAECVVVLKGVFISGATGTILELYWHCMTLFFPYILQDLEDVGCTVQCTAHCTIPYVGIGDTMRHTMCCTFPCSAFIHFTEIWHIVSFHYIFLWLIQKQYSHSECSTIAEQVGAVIRICDYKSVQVLFTPKLQVGTELS